LVEQNRQANKCLSHLFGNKEVPVTVRKFIPLAAVLGLCAAGPAVAQEPAMMKPVASTASKDSMTDQHLADNIASHLKVSGVMKGAKVDLETRKGTVLLKGEATSVDQHMQILRTIKNVKGVTRIESEIQVASEMPAIRRAGGQVEGAPLARPMPVAEPNFNDLLAQTPTATPPAVGAPVAPVQHPMAAPYASSDPVPLNGGMAMAPLDPAGPTLPPHAWPTYAPYNNYSRVAYPGSYPYQAFPYIGPFYPFPKVPLGWRKVVLEWDDGYWYLGRLKSPHDNWRVKFW
jgi:hypothetical protein